MRQCPDCEEKDRVVIAGKIFCANCGTPWQPTDSNEEATYKQKVGLGGSATQTNASDTVAVSAPTDPQLTVQTPQPEPVATSTPPTPVAPPQTRSEPVAPPVALETPMPVPQVSSAVSASTAPPAPPVSASAPTTPVPTPPPSPSVSAPSITSSAPHPPVPAPVTSVPTPVSSTVQAPTISSSPAAEPQSRIGAEIHSLDAKDESVLSDAQIKEMAAIASPPPAPDPQPISAETPTPPQSTTAPAPAPSVPQPPVVTSPATNGRVLNDIVAPSASSAAAPTAIEATPSQPSPTPSPPTDSPPTTTTVAGVTMSREDALKLALGDSAVSEVMQKSGPARPTAVVMTVVGLALLGVFLWQVNANDINVKIASLRSGLSASVPGFVPGGWGKAQSLKSSDGNVSYELEKDGKTLKIEQQKSDWDSQAVLEQYVLKRATDYLALQSQGLTIYVFGNNQAAWVNQGTLYTLSGDHGIDQDDIIRMATSL